jgi:hypothetical protein
MAEQLCSRTIGKLIGTAGREAMATDDVTVMQGLEVRLVPGEVSDRSSNSSSHLGLTACVPAGRLSSSISSQPAPLQNSVRLAKR